MNKLKIKSCIMFILLAALSSCDGKSSDNTTIPSELTKYPEIELVNFTISGTSACTRCNEVAALQVEVVPSDDVLTTLASNTFDGLGPFNFPSVRYKKGAKLNVYGKVFFGENSGASAETSATIKVPDVDGEIVTCVLNF